MRRRRIQLSRAELDMVHRTMFHINTRSVMTELTMQRAVQRIEMPGGEIVLTGQNRILWNMPFRRWWWPSRSWHRNFILSTATWSFHVRRRNNYDTHPPFDGCEEDFRRDMALMPLFMDFSQ